MASHMVSQDNKDYIRDRIIIDDRERKFLGTKIPWIGIRLGAVTSVLDDEGRKAVS